MLHWTKSLIYNNFGWKSLDFASLRSMELGIARKFSGLLILLFKQVGFFSFCLLMECVSVALSSEAYIPENRPQLGELWRWSEIENIERRELNSADRDEAGNIWFGRKDGLTFYDGKTFVEYSFPFENGDAWEGMDVFCASDGLVYLMTNRVLASFDPNTEKWRFLKTLERYLNHPFSFAESSDGVVWTALGSGLFRIGANGMEKVSNRYLTANSIAIDQSDRVWLSLKDSAEIVVLSFENYEKGGEREPIIRIPLDSDVGNRGGGLLAVDDGSVWSFSPEATHVLRRFDMDFTEEVLPNPPVNLHQSMQSFNVLSEGRLLLQTPAELMLFDQGVWEAFSVVDYPLPTNLPILLPLGGDRFFIGGKTARGFVVDLSNDRWETIDGLVFCTEDVELRNWFIDRSGRVVCHDPKEENWIAYDSSDGVIDSPNAITAGRDGIIWVSGAHEGSAAVSRLEKGRWILDVYPEFGKTFSFLANYKTTAGDVVLGNGTESFAEDQYLGGVVVYRLIKNEYVATMLTPPLYPKRPASIVERKGDGLWFGEFLLYRSKASNALGVKEVDQFESIWIDHLAVDSNNDLWVCRWGEGVFRYDGSDWGRFGYEDGVGSNQAVFALADRAGKGLWVATSAGLSRYDGQSWSEDVLETGIRFQRESAFLVEDRRADLWMNLSDRAWLLNLDRGGASERRHKTIRYRPDGVAPETTLRSVGNIQREPANQVFSWSGVDPWGDTHSKNLEFSYRISGGEWSPFSSEKNVSLLDLVAGKYLFEVRARDKDWNIDESPASVNFEVIAPLWKRPWFIALVCIVVALFVGLIVLIVRMRVRHLLALEAFKLEFFTNLSHELRTPLSVILSPIERLAANAESDVEKRTFELVLRNSKKMLGLVNQLLEFRKVELGSLKYQSAQGEIVGFVKDAVYSLAPLWENRRQTLEVESSVDVFKCGFDPDKLQRIVDNVLSNSIKYTEEGGFLRVALKVEETSIGEGLLVLSFADNGIGISPDKISHVFDPFYQAQQSTNELKSSGLGLALVKELVDLWGGEVSIKSSTDGSDKGTCVTLRLRLGACSVLPESVAIVSGEVEEGVVVKEDANSKVKVLIVEDNPDVLEVLRYELSPHYEVVAATNGIEGLEAAAQYDPDIVVTDVMMPEMDGLEFCRRIREAREICHLPIIALTARGAEEHHVEGIEIGVDEYFVKPVKIPLLLARIENLLKSRSQLRDVFSKQIVVESKSVAVVSSDQDLLDRAIALLEENLQTENYSVEKFAKDLGFSRVSLYRKLKAITGLTVVDFMRSIRLKRAAQLLQSTDLSVGEILFQVGFYDASNFSRSFKKEFEMSPTQFREKMKES